MWQCHVKNVLLIIWTTALLLTAPAITLIIHGNIWKGLLILFIAVSAGVISLSIATYWHKRGIHATFLGFIVALIFFIAGSVWLWFYGFYFWIPVTIVALPIAYGYLTGKNK